MKARVCEAFYSVQGEGRFVGVPSVSYVCSGVTLNAVGLVCQEVNWLMTMT